MQVFGAKGPPGKASVAGRSLITVTNPDSVSFSGQPGIATCWNENLFRRSTARTDV